MKKFYIALLLLCLNSYAQISQVKDIFPGQTTNVENGAAPTNLFDFNGSLLFRANDGVNGVELWKSDGTDAGTSLISNIAPTTTNSNPANFIIFNNKVYFSATTGTAVSGSELYSTDGTTAGTAIIKDINPGTANGNPQNFVVLNPTTMVFSASNGTQGVELWKTDGTGAGTVNVVDYPGTTNSITWIENLNSTLILGQIVSTTGREIYKSDGTAMGSSLVKDIYPGTSIGVNTSSVKAGNFVYFAGNSAETGYELWKTDGTDAGTTLVKDINPGTTTSSPSRFVAIGNNVFFKATGPNGEELWKSDGTEVGTVEVANLNPTGNSAPDQLRVIDNVLYFFASDDGTNFDLYKYELNELKKVYDFNTLSATLTTSYEKIGDLIYFAVDSNNSNGRELWQTNGTTAGTVAVSSLVSGWLNPNTVGNVTLSNGNIFFSGTVSNGSELFVYKPVTLSKEMFDQIADLKVYPNPVSSDLFIANQFSSPVQYTITDLLGKTILEGELQGNKIPFNTISKGVYLLKIHSQNQSVTKKIIKN